MSSSPVAPNESCATSTGTRSRGRWVFRMAALLSIAFLSMNSRRAFGNCLVRDFHSGRPDDRPSRPCDRRLVSVRYGAPDAPFVLLPIPPPSLSSAALRLWARPVEIDSSGSGQWIAINADPSSLLLLDESGKPLSLPLIHDVADGPLSLSVLAASFGESALTATLLSGSPFRVLAIDRVVFRGEPREGFIGKPEVGVPPFRRVGAFLVGERIGATLDTRRFADRQNQPAKLWLVPHRSAASYLSDPILHDPLVEPREITFAPGSILENRFELGAARLACSDRLACSFDLVFDFGRDGRLDPGDLFQGALETTAAFTVLGDASAPGPFPKIRSQYTNSQGRAQIVTFPDTGPPAAPFPLVVFCHANGYQFSWYSDFCDHLASWGYVVLTIDVDTGGYLGSRDAAIAMISDADELIRNQAVVAGGRLAGRIDASRIAFAGHSRGGEGAAITFGRLVDGLSRPTTFGADAVKAVVSLAPSVNQGTLEANPRQTDYLLIYGSADVDVREIRRGRPASLFESRLHPRAGRSWSTSREPPIPTSPAAIPRPEREDLWSGGKQRKRSFGHTFSPSSNPLFGEEGSLILSNPERSTTSTRRVFPRRLLAL